MVSASDALGCQIFRNAPPSFSDNSRSPDTSILCGAHRSLELLRVNLSGTFSHLLTRGSDLVLAHDIPLQPWMGYEVGQAEPHADFFGEHAVKQVDKRRIVLEVVTSLRAV